MKFGDICARLEAALYDASTRYILRLNKELDGQHIYAFAVILSGGDSISITANTLEYLNKRVVEQKTLEPAHFRVSPIYLEMSAAEWVHLNGFWEMMSPVNDILSDFREKHYAENGFDDLKPSLNYDQIAALADARLKQIIIRVLERLREEGCFSGHGFTDDVFLGLQHTDMGLAELAVIEALSKPLNSEYWAAQIARLKTWMMEQSNA